MSSDFEQQLKQRPIRMIPPDWRTDILRNARAITPESANAAPAEEPVWWQAIFRRVPAAWGSLAALWLMIVCVNGMIFGSINSPANGGAPVIGAAEEPFSLRQLQITGLRLTDPDAVPARLTPAPPAPDPNGPRSDARTQRFAMSHRTLILETTL